MSTLVVADAGPLIGLARVGHLSLLQRLYGSVLVPPAVAAELQAGGLRPGAQALGEAIAAGWLVTVAPAPSTDPQPLELILDPGESEAIRLAEQVSAHFLLIDERRGRSVARRRGLRVVGTAGILLVAKRRGLLAQVADVVEALAAAGYRLSPDLRARILAMAGEAE